MGTDVKKNSDEHAAQNVAYKLLLRAMNDVEHAGKMLERCS
jgi:hypothetical protein